MTAAGVWGALAVAVLAMAALHVVQPALSPWMEPVSFYLHGRHGWLLPVALGSFGLAGVLLAGGAGGRGLGSGSRGALLFFGGAMVVVAAVPSDAFFPWENLPSASGLIHAGLSVLAPPVLLWPMWRRPPKAAPTRRGRTWAQAHRWVYGAGLLASGLSLLVGWRQGGPPPWIGLAERVLAWAAVGWLAWAAA